MSKNLLFLFSTCFPVGTYKMKKLDLQKEGFDPSLIRDKLYYSSPSGCYEPLTQDVYTQLKTGKIRL